MYSNFLIFRILSKNFIQEIRKGHFTGLVSLVRLIIDDNNIWTADLSDFENSTLLEWM